MSTSLVRQDGWVFEKIYLLLKNEKDTVVMIKTLILKFLKIYSRV